MTDNQHDDLNWLAFRYIADEMSDDERSRFDARLADDLAAQQAVAQAVELTQAIALSEALEKPALSREPVATTSQSQTWLRRAVWMAAGASACLALVVAFQAQFFPRGNDVPSADSQELAIAWGETLADWSTEVSANEAVIEEEEASLTQAITELVTQNEEEEDLETPSWMLIAVGAPTAEEEEDDEGWDREREFD